MAPALALGLALTIPRNAGGGGAAKPLRLVAGPGRFGTATVSLTQQFMSAYPMYATDDITSIAVAMTNFYTKTTVGYEYGTALPLTIDKASVEYPIGGSRYPLFFSGSRSIILPAIPTAGATTEVGLVFSDLLALPITIPKGGKYRIRFHGTTGGTTIFRQSGADPDNILFLSTSGTGNAAPVSVDDGEGTFTNNAAAGYCIPVPAVIGYTNNTTVGMVADSITYDQNQLVLSSADPLDARLGIIATSLPSDMAFFNGAGPGLKAAEVLARSPGRSVVWPYCSEIFVELGVNDLGAAGADTTVINALSAIAAALPAGANKHVCTITPRTSATTTFYTTTAGQTALGSTPGTQRGTINVAIRNGTVTGYKTVCDIDAALEFGTSVIWDLDAKSRTVTDASMSSGSNVLTSATANFLSTDDATHDNVWVRVVGAGAAGADLTGRIGTVISSTQVALIGNAGAATNASTPVSGATAYIAPRTFDGLHPTTLGNKRVAASGVVMASINTP